MRHTKWPAGGWSMMRVRLNKWEFPFASGCFFFALSSTAAVETMCEGWDWECLHISLARECFLFHVRIQNHLSPLLSHCHQSKTPSGLDRLWSFGAMGQEFFFLTHFPRNENYLNFTHIHLSADTRSLTSSAWLILGFYGLADLQNRYRQMPTWPHCLLSVS